MHGWLEFVCACWAINFTNPNIYVCVLLDEIENLYLKCWFFFFPVMYPYLFFSNFTVLNRKQRHVGPHDGGGIQRVISTGM